MKETTKSFYRGVMAALAVVAVYDQETLFREIVSSVGEKELLAVVEGPEDAEWTGLKKYGYVKKTKK